MLKPRPPVMHKTSFHTMLKILSVLATIGMAGGVLELLFQHFLFSSNALVIACQIGAALLMLWARKELGLRSLHASANPTRGGLVTGGPYRHVRHPIYTSVCLFVWAGALGNISTRSMIIATVLLFSALVRMFCEEMLIIDTYPEYADYMATTWRMIPYIF